VLGYGRAGDERRKPCGMDFGITDRMGVTLDHSGDASGRLAGS
jgi:hypothetical protein